MIGATYAADVSYNDGLPLAIAPHSDTIGSGLAPNRTDYHTYPSFIGPNHVLSTDSTFAAGVDHNNGTALTPYNWGDAAIAGHTDYQAFVPSPPRLNENTFTVDAPSNGGRIFSIAPHLYPFGPGAASTHTNSHAFVPMAGQNPSSLNENTFTAGLEHPNGMALSTSPTPYNWGMTAAPALMHPQVHANPYTTDHSLSMMNPYAAATTGNVYQNPLPATNLTVPVEAAVESPAMVSSTRDHVTDLAQYAPRRPTCATCGESFGRQADLDRHARKHRAGSNIFRCPVPGCEFSNYRKDKLAEHVRRRHRHRHLASGAASN